MEICPVENCLGYDDRKETLVLHLYQHIVDLDNIVDKLEQRKRKNKLCPFCLVNPYDDVFENGQCWECRIDESY